MNDLDTPLNEYESKYWYNKTTELVIFVLGIHVITTVSR